jgi:hypothetical protein
VLPRVLIVSPEDLTPLLGRTMLWRNDIERVFAPGAAACLETARRIVPNLIVVHGTRVREAAELLRALRSDGATRRVSLAAIVPPGEEEDALRLSGANLVIPSAVDPTVWDRRLEELLDVPPRREARLHAAFELWCRADPKAALHEGVVLNISVRGMLIETPESLPVGSTVDLRLALPDTTNEPAGEPVSLVGLVVRSTAAADAGGFQSGVQFLILRDPVRERIRSFIEAEIKE